MTDYYLSFFRSVLFVSAIHGVTSRNGMDRGLIIQENGREFPMMSREIWDSLSRRMENFGKDYCILSMIFNHLLKDVFRWFHEKLREDGNMQPGTRCNEWGEWEDWSLIFKDRRWMNSLCSGVSNDRSERGNGSMGDEYSRWSLD